MKFSNAMATVIVVLTSVVMFTAMGFWKHYQWQECRKDHGWSYCVYEVTR